MIVYFIDAEGRWQGASAERDLDARPYTEKRKSEYPDFIEYFDGIVKGGQAQIDKYIADCKTVKAKYPKG